MTYSTSPATNATVGADPAPLPQQEQAGGQKVVLVTGASSGIGEATARKLADEGHIIVAAARRIDRLHALAAELSADGCQATAHALDVTDREQYVQLVEETVNRYGRLDVLVANAGVMLLSRLDALITDEWDRMLDVNVRGLYNGLASVLPHFERRGCGHVVTVASIGAHQVVPTSAIYSATKYAAWAMTEGLRLESRPEIRVTTISPGVVESELADHITDADAAQVMKQYRADSIPASAVANAISFALAQPADVDVNEIIVRPARQR